MKKLFCDQTKVIFDVRTLICFSGVVVSIIVHELFHIIVHWGEIESIHIFPDTKAIVAINLASSLPYDIAVEEAVAYGISMVTLILTAMLIGDISHLKRERGKGLVVHQVLARDDTINEEKARNHLANILGVA